MWLLHGFMLTAIALVVYSTDTMTMLLWDGY